MELPLNDKRVNALLDECPHLRVALKRAPHIRRPMGRYRGFHAELLERELAMDLQFIFSGSPMIFHYRHFDDNAVLEFEQESTQGIKPIQERLSKILPEEDHRLQSFDLISQDANGSSLTYRIVLSHEPTNKTRTYTLHCALKDDLIVEAKLSIES